MEYLHISNLYKERDILLFRRCYALEKVHGTSAHVTWGAAGLTFFSGGESHTRFVGLFDAAVLQDRFRDLGHADVTIYGEAYGGSQQCMKLVYGAELRFIAFDVQVGDRWLSVPDAAQVSAAIGIEFVPYEEISTDLAELDRVRDQPSEVAVRRGCGADRPREGVVLRPLIELTKNNGSRIIVKHKADSFAERATPPKVVDVTKLEVLAAADAIAQEWVTPMRLAHVLDKLGAVEMSDVPKVIHAMVEDVFRETKGEIVESKDARSAIGKRTARLFKEYLEQPLRAPICEGSSERRRVLLPGGGEALVPSAPYDARQVIVLVLLGEERVGVRLDTQKEMFIDAVPGEIGDAVRARELASFLSRDFRGGH